jgi:hypothetical protein
MNVPTITIWAADFGDIVLPDDFPGFAMRLGGRFDRRYKIVRDGKAYIAEQSKKLETGQEPSGFRAPSFNEWRRTDRPVLA